MGRELAHGCLGRSYRKVLAFISRMAASIALFLIIVFTFYLGDLLTFKWRLESAYYILAYAVMEVIREKALSQLEAKLKMPKLESSVLMVLTREGVEKDNLERIKEQIGRMGYTVSDEYVFELKTRDYIGKSTRRIPSYADFAANLAKHFNSHGIPPNLLYCNFGETMVAFIIGRKLRKIKHQVFQRHGCVFHTDRLAELDKEFERDNVRLSVERLKIKISVVDGQLHEDVYEDLVDVRGKSNKELLKLLKENLKRALERIGNRDAIIYFDETKGEVNLQALSELGRPVLMVSIRKEGVEWRWREDLLYIGLLTRRIYNYLRRYLKGRSHALILKTPSSVAHILGIHSFGVPVEVYHYDLDADRYTYVYRDPPGEMVEIGNLLKGHESPNRA